MASAPRFVLVKWYLDLVTADGRALLGYAAWLRWGGYRQGYGSVLLHDPGGRTLGRTSLRFEPPALAHGAIRWPAAHLGILGTWTPRAPLVERCLPTAGGPVWWSCVAPAADADVELVDGAGTYLGSDVVEGATPPSRLRGMGYVERLALSTPPWCLGLEQLRWGRFVSPRDALVWIDWRGEQRATVAFHLRPGAAGAGGRALATWEGYEVGLDEAGIRLGDASLTFHERRTLRSGAIAGTALAGVPAIRRVVPASILGTNEHKWLGRATWGDPDGASVGWCVDEVVRFGAAGGGTR